MALSGTIASRSRTEWSPMSRISRPSARKLDRRVERTRRRLGSALWDLLQEHPVDAITVQQVLDRADVGRSTFYAHFRGKDDLLVGEIERFLEMTAGLLQHSHAGDRVIAVREFFTHVAEAPEFHVSLTVSGRMQ